MDRLRRLLYEEAEEQRKRHTKAMRKTYRDQLREIQLEKEREKSAQHKRKLPVGHKLLLFSLLSIEALLCFVLNGLLKIIEGFFRPDGRQSFPLHSSYRVVILQCYDIKAEFKSIQYIFLFPSSETSCILSSFPFLHFSWYNIQSLFSVAFSAEDSQITSRHSCFGSNQ